MITIDRVAPASWRGLLLSGASRPPRVALVWAAALMTVIVAVDPEIVSSPLRFPDDEHAKASVEIALNVARCGRPAVRSNRFKLAQDLVSNPDGLLVPAPDLIRSQAGTLDAYCASLTDPVTHNENGLM